MYWKFKEDMFVFKVNVSKIHHHIIHQITTTITTGGAKINYVTVRSPWVAIPIDDPCENFDTEDLDKWHRLGR